MVRLEDGLKGQRNNHGPYINGLVSKLDPVFTTPYTERESERAVRVSLKRFCGPSWFIFSSCFKC